MIKIKDIIDAAECEPDINQSQDFDDFFFYKGLRTFLGYENCKTNVLAERDDSVVKSLCYDE